MSNIDLRYYVLMVRQPGQDRALGTAFLISDSEFGYAATCHHVIKNHEKVELYFEPGDIVIPVEVVSDCSNKEYDISILKLKEIPPSSIQILDFAPSITDVSGKEFSSYGFQELAGIRIKGEIMGFIPSSQKANVPKSIDLGLLQLKTTDIKEGASGAPVVLEATSSVVGMVVNYYQPENPQLMDLALAQPLKAIWQVCPSISHMLPLINRQEWLSFLKFRLDPFKYLDGGNDPNLLEYFHRVPHFSEILGDVSMPQTVIVFGASGSGKSSLRNAIGKTCFDEGAFPIVLTNFDTLVDIYKQRGKVSIEDLISLLIQASIRTWVTAITKSKNDDDRDDKEREDSERTIILKMGLCSYIDYYEDDPIIQNDIKEFLQVNTSQTTNSLHENYHERFGRFCRYLREFMGYESIYFLVDPDKNISSDINTSWEVLEPLLSMNLQSLSTDGIAFKFFLNHALSGFVTQIPWIESAQKQIIYNSLKWSRSDLLKLLQTRLRLSSNFQPPYESLAQISNVEDLDNIVLRHSSGQPRELIAVCNRIVSLHCNQKIDPTSPYITQDTINKVLDSLELEIPDPTSLRIIRGEQKLTPFVIENLIAEGENDWVEFKSTMRWDIKAGKRNNEIDKIIAKTISGFMNSEGGILIIGVDNEGKAVGLQHDFKTLSKHNQNEDGFESAFSDIVNNYLELRHRQNISDISFFDYEDHRICAIQIARSSQEIYLKGDKEYEFHVRVGNSTRKFDVKSAIEYILERF